MMYARYYLVLTLMSMIGLALPSDPQRKISKGSKKNPSMLFQEEFSISLVAPQGTTVPELKAAVTEVLHDILNDDERRGLLPLRQQIYLFALEIRDMTERECVEKYLTEARCHAATIVIKSKEDLKKRISKMEVLLDKVIHIKDIFMSRDSKNKQGGIGYPTVLITNLTPYDVDYNAGGFFQDAKNIVEYSGFMKTCLDDIIVREGHGAGLGLESGETWFGDETRGLCLVNTIRINLNISPNDDDGDTLVCTPYSSSGTSYSDYFIIMTGDDACDVQSSHESGITITANF